MDLKSPKTQTWLKVGGVALAGLIVAPVIFLMIKGILGLIVAAAIGCVAVALVPSITEWVGQTKLKAVKGVISRAPIESLYKRAKERQESLVKSRTTLTEFIGELESFRNDVKKFRKSNPEDVEQYESQLAKYEKLLNFRVEKFKQAVKAHDAFMKAIDRAESIYTMAVSASKLQKYASNQDDFMNMFKEKTAFDEVDRASNEALSQLEMAFIDEDYIAQNVDTVAPRQIQYEDTGAVKLGSILDIKTREVVA